MNYYDLLEVSPKASQETIKAAYRSLMQRHHPDKNRNDTQSAELSANISNAYQTLSDPVARAEYDKKLETEFEKNRHISTSNKMQSSPIFSSSNSSTNLIQKLIVGLLFGFVIMAMLAGISRLIDDAEESIKNKDVADIFEEETKKSTLRVDSAKKKTSISFTPFENNIVVELKDAVDLEGRSIKIRIPEIVIVFWSTSPTERWYSPMARKYYLENDRKTYETYAREWLSKLKYSEINSRCCKTPSIRMSRGLSVKLTPWNLSGIEIMGAET